MSFNIKMKYKKNITFFILHAFIVMLWQCTSSTPRRDIRAYYYPFKELRGSGLVYEYRPVGNDSLPPEYWRHVFEETDSGEFLVSNFYNAKLENTQQITEEVVGNGTIFKECLFFGKDTNGMAKVERATIKSANAFPFELSQKSGILISELEFHDFEQPELRMVRVRNKQFMQDTTYQYKGKTLDAVVFFDKDLIEYHFPQRELLSYEGQKIETYARGIGLAHYRQRLGGHTFLEYALAARYPFPEFEALFTKKEKEQ